MINLFHRYIFKELSISIFASFCFFLLVLVLANAFQDLAELLLSGKIGFQEFFQLVSLLIPYLAIYAIPLAVLSGILIAFGRLSADGEITAMKSAGFSLFQISASVFFISFITMALSAMVTLHFGPKSALNYKSILAKTLIENPLGFINEGDFIEDFPGYVIYVNEREGLLLKDLWIWELDNNNQVNLFLKANQGSLDYSEENNSIMLDLVNGSIEKRSLIKSEEMLIDNPDILFFEALPILLPLENLIDNFSEKPTRYKNMTISQLIEKREELIDQEQEIGEKFSKERGRLQLYIHQNLSQAYSVFALIFIGVPLALNIKRKESYFNVLVALFIALIYHTMFVFISWFEGLSGFRSDILVWIPNIIFQIVGMILFSRAAKH